MQQYIGSTNAAVLVEQVTYASSLHIKRAQELENFTRRSHTLHNAGEPPDMAISRSGAEADAAIQLQPFDIDMVLTAPFQNSLQTNNNIQLTEAQTQANEQLLSDSYRKTAKSPHQINLEEVANKVYRLMQYDLILERERATKMGG